MPHVRGDLMLRSVNGGWHCSQQAAQAALKAIEWFGLKELYDAYIPEDFGREEADAA